MADRVSWFVDGRPVRISNWSADCTAHGGFRDFSGTAQGSLLWAGQEAEVAGYRRDGSPFWFGTMTLDPEITEGGATIKAEGLFKGEFSTKSGRQFYLAREETAFKLMTAAPFLLAAPGDAYEWKIEPGLMRWFGVKGEAVSSGDLDGCVFWAPGAVLTYIGATLQSNPAITANDKYRVLTSFGPTGAQSQEGSDIAATSAALTQALSATSGDMVNLIVRRQGVPVTFAKQLRGVVRDIEVRGLATSSVFTIGDVFGVVLKLDQRPVNVAPSSLDLMPLDFTGTQFDLATYLSTLADWWFMILDRDASGTRAAAGPWEAEIQVARRRNTKAVLNPLRRYNQVRLPWQNTAGVQNFAVAVADPNPFPDTTVEYLAEQLADKFSPDSLVPQDVADTMILRYASVRRSGTIEVAEASLDTKNLSPYEIQPGVLVNITDHDPLVPPQRVEVVAWSSSGTASLTIEEDASAVGNLKELNKTISQSSTTTNSRGV